MGHTGTRRTWAAALAAAVVGAVLIVLPAPPATACSCAVTTPEAQIDGAEVAFIARQVDRRDIPGRGTFANVVLEMELIEVYRGDVGSPGDVVEVRTNNSPASCGIGGLEGRGEVGIVSRLHEGGYPISSCGGVVSADVLRFEFEPLPTPGDTALPAFVASTTLGDARIALIDARGKVIHYGRGDGVVRAMALCPGRERLVELVEPDVPGNEVGGDLVMAVRNLSSMEVEFTGRFDVTTRPKRWQFRELWVRDVQCHDPAADLVTYLLPVGRYGSETGLTLTNHGTMHVWDQGRLREVEVGKARSLAVDPAGNRFWTVAGPTGQGVATFELDTGQRIASDALPGEDVGWLLAHSPDLDRVAVLAFDPTSERRMFEYASVNELLILEPAGGFARLPLGVRGTVVGLDVLGADFVATVSPDTFGPALTVAVGPDGTVRTVAEAPASTGPGAFALAESIGLYAPLETSELIAAPFDGRPFVVEGVANATALVVVDRAAPPPLPAASGGVPWVAMMLAALVGGAVVGMAALWRRARVAR